MIARINSILERWLFALAPLGVAFGFLFSDWLLPVVFIIPWVFALMTFSGSLGTSFADLTRVMIHPKPILACLLILHVIMPVIAFGTGILLFPGDILTITGLVLIFVIPTGIISFVWVSIYQGNIALTLSLILVSTLLSPIVVPYSMALFVGSEIEMNTLGIMKGLIWMVVIPSMLGMLLNQLTKGEIKHSLGRRLSPVSKIGLVVVISINAAAVTPYLQALSWRLVGIALTVLILATLGYVIGWLMARFVFKWERDKIVALTFNSGMRNNSTGAVLAITYFPPPVAIPVITGMLFQQLLATLFGFLLKRLYR
jgi:predicted Na+-dependent transporter